MYLIVNLVFSHLGFWSGNLFLIAPFPDLCLLVTFYKKDHSTLLHIIQNMKALGLVVSEKKIFLVFPVVFP